MKWFFACVLFLGLTSCNPNRFEVNDLDTSQWKPLLAFPLFTAEIKVSDLLREINENSVIRLNKDDGFMSLVMESKTYTFQANKLFSFEDVEQQISFNLPTSTFPANGKIEVTQQIQFPIIQSSDKVYSVLLNDGEVLFDPQFSGTTGSFEISSNSITKDGLPVLFSGTLNGGSSNSLSGHLLKLNSNNEIIADVKIIITGTPGSSVGSLTRSAKLKFLSIKAQLIKCYISPKAVASLTDTIPFEMFDLNNLNGGIDFLKPTIKFYSQNSFGGNVKFIIDELAGINNQENVSKVNFGSGNNELNINKPSNIGEVVSDSQTVNVSSSLASVLKSSPNKIYYNNRILLNDGIMPSDTNFILDTSAIRIKGELEIPLQIRFPVLDFSFVRPIDLSSLSINEFEYIKFQMEFYNKFPLELRFQCVFLDENEVAFDSLFSHGSSLFNSEPLDKNGRINEVSIQKTEIIVGLERANALSKAKFVRIKLGFNTANEGKEWVKFYDDYRLGMKCKVLTKASISELY